MYPTAVQDRGTEVLKKGKSAIMRQGLEEVQSQSTGR
jgi:hypothetical protein